MPSFVETNVGSLKRARLKPTHGPMISSAATSDDDGQRAAVGPRAPDGQRDDDTEQRHEQDQLGAAERREPAQRTEREGTRQCRAVPEREGQQQRGDDHEDGDRLGHHQSVVDPDVRRDGRDAGGDETDGVTADARRPSRPTRNTTSVPRTTIA